jgi:hypothetical protein
MKESNLMHFQVFNVYFLIILMLIDIEIFVNQTIIGKEHFLEFLGVWGHVKRFVLDVFPRFQVFRLALNQKVFIEFFVPGIDCCGIQIDHRLLSWREDVWHGDLYTSVVIIFRGSYSRGSFFLYGPVFLLRGREHILIFFLALKSLLNYIALKQLFFFLFIHHHHLFNQILHPLLCSTSTSSCRLDVRRQVTVGWGLGQDTKTTYLMVGWGSFPRGQTEMTMRCAMGRGN